ncbi:MAG: class I SAM-dependent methyltransferase [Deltaproteobacteria bacterium]|nr:class I SAM-dependent methyltransferase [Deltaproteobacteria bacterium]
MKRVEEILKFWASQDLANIQSRESYFEMAFFDIMQQHLQHSRRIMEIGVGSGRFVKILKEYNIGERHDGIDLMARKKVTSFNLIIGDARRLPVKDNAYDFTCSLGVVEHFPETDLSTAEHVRITAQNGYILITTPHLTFDTPFRYLAYFFHRFFKKDKYVGCTFETVYGRFLTIRHLKTILERHHCRILAHGAYRPSWHLLKNFAPRLYRAWDRMFPERHFGSHLFILSRKAASHST